MITYGKITYESYGYVAPWSQTYSRAYRLYLA